MGSSSPACLDSRTESLPQSESISQQVIKEKTVQISEILSSLTLKPGPDQNLTLLNTNFVLFYAQFVKCIQDESYETVVVTLLSVIYSLDFSLAGVSISKFSVKLLSCGFIKVCLQPLKGVDDDYIRS